MSDNYQSRWRFSKHKRTDFFLSSKIKIIFKFALKNGKELSDLYFKDKHFKEDSWSLGTGFLTIITHKLIVEVNKFGT